MKKILIIAYYYPPCIGISANRSSAFANDFSKENEVKVITRHWEGNENYWLDYLQSNDKNKEREYISKNLEIIRLQYKSKLKRKNKLLTLFDMALGKLEKEIDSMQFYTEASLIIEEWYPDIILVSSPPLNIISLANKLHKKYKTPFIADFRDFENSIVLRPTHNLNFKEFIYFRLTLRKIKKDLKNATIITSINNNICKYLEKISKKTTYLIYNGFEESIFGNFKSINEIKTDYFNISIIGTIYENQSIDIFLESFDYIIKTNPNMKIKFNFIGTDSIPSISKKITDMLHPEHINITKKIPRKDALLYLENSHIVWQPEMLGYKGVYSGKIFEYIGSKRIIIVAPSANDVLDNLLLETSAGKSFKTSKQIADFITIKYKEWENGTIKYNGNYDVIRFYSRENQSSILLNLILNNIN